MRKRLLTFAASLALSLGSLVSSAPANPAAASLTCPLGADAIGSGNTYAIIYEANDFVNVGHPDNEVLCLKASSVGGLGVPDLKAVRYDFILSDGICDGQLATSYGTWNDCTSALKVNIDCHHKVSFYSSSSYGNLLYSFSTSGSRSSMPPGYNDTISSIRITYNSVCATIAGQ